MALHGLVGEMTFPGATDAHAFRTYVTQVLVPNLWQGATNEQIQTFELIILVVLWSGINGLVRLCAALNITSLVFTFYHNIYLAINTSRENIWRFLIHLSLVLPLEENRFWCNRHRPSYIPTSYRVPL